MINSDSSDGIHYRQGAYFQPEIDTIRPAGSASAPTSAKVAVPGEAQRIAFQRVCAVDVTRYFKVNWREPRTKE